MEYKTVPTICAYCGCGCTVLIEVLDGKVVGVLPSKSHPINDGSLCIKGWKLHEFIYSADRLRKPLIRDSKGELVETDWQKALDYASSRLKEIKETSGPDAIAALSSAKCTNEENYLLQKFIRATVGTNNIDHCARL